MIRKMSVHIPHRCSDFSNIFDSQLVEYTNAEPIDKEDWLYIRIPHRLPLTYTFPDSNA
jgi:hypothetical protein